MTGELKAEEQSAPYDVGWVRPEAVTHHGQSAATWKMLPLKELGSWTGGGTPSKANTAYWESGSIPWVSPKDMKTEWIHDSEDHITEQAVSESTANLIPAGSILLVTRSGILRHTLPVAVTTVPVTVNQDLKALTLRAGILPQYVAWALRTFSQEILNTCSKQGTTVNSLETPRLLRFEIPIAPLDQQKRIVAEIEKQFSRLDEAVANLKRVKANLKRYKASVLKAALEGRLVETEGELARREGRVVGAASRRSQRQNAAPTYETGAELLQRILETRRSQWNGKGKYKEPAAPDTTNLPKLPEGWVWASLGALLVDIEAGKSFKCEERPPTKDEIGVVKVSAVTWGEFDEGESKTCLDKRLINGKLLVRSGDLLFSRANTIELVGACVIAKKVTSNVMLSDKILRFRLLGGLEQWVLYNLRSTFGREEIERLATGNQESMRNIGQDRIRAIRIPLPPVDECGRIVAEIEQRFSHVEETEIQVVANLRRVERLRQSILSRSFTGVIYNSLPSSAMKEPGLNEVKSNVTSGTH